MKRLGLRGRHSVMNNATPVQVEKVDELMGEADAAGVRVFETRWPCYIGPGSAPPGSVETIVDGRIFWTVTPEGVTY